MRKLKRLYIGKKDNDNLHYELGTKKKYWYPRYGFGTTTNSCVDCGYLVSFCPELFEAVTGIKLEPGEVRRVKIHMELLD